MARINSMKYVAGSTVPMRVKNPRHRFAREDEAGEEHRRQDEDHAHLERLHLVLRARGDEQAEAQQRKDVEQRRKQQGRGFPGWAPRTPTA